VSDPDSPTEPLKVGEFKLADVCRTNVVPDPVVGVGSPQRLYWYPSKNHSKIILVEAATVIDVIFVCCATEKLEGIVNVCEFVSVFTISKLNQDPVAGGALNVNVAPAAVDR
jgi:hypothetical protein